MTIALLRANRTACRLATITNSNHVRITIRNRSALANWLRSVQGLFAAEGWEV
jgi:hypothetical protein